jgi:restriction system protein
MENFFVALDPFTFIVGFVAGCVIIWHRWRRDRERDRLLIIEQKKRQRVVQREQQSDKARQFWRVSQVSAIKSLDALALEQYTAELFQRMGYQISLTPKTGDHGVDVKMTSPRGEREVVQCKQWPSRNRGLVGEPEVRDFYGTMMAESAVLGYVVAPHGFTQEAMTWAIGKPIVLADANWLYLKAIELNLQIDNLDAKVVSQPPEEHAQENSPLCPIHGVPMVRRVAAKGSYVGQPFWGCPNYPHCTEIIQV